MSRSMADFSPGERNAYVVWTQKLADRTLPKAEHDLANAELDKLFRRGPFAELHLLKDELAQIKSRLAVLEEFVLGSPADVAMITPTLTPTPRPPLTKTAARPHSLDNKFPRPEPVPGLPGILGFKTHGAEQMSSVAPEFFNSALGEEFIVKAEGHVENPPAADAVENAEENRGRKPLRFHPEKGANKQWFVLDRRAGEYTDHGPYKTRREAKEMADTLNQMGGNPPAPAGKNRVVYQGGDPIALGELPDECEAMGDLRDWSTHPGDPTDMDVLEDYQENFDLGF